MFPIPNLKDYAYGAGLVLFAAGALWLHGVRIDSIKAAHESEKAQLRAELTAQCNDALLNQKQESDGYYAKQLANCSRTGAAINRVYATCGVLDAGTAKASNDCSRCGFLRLDRNETAELAGLLGMAQHNTTVALECIK